MAAPASADPQTPGSCRVRADSEFRRSSPMATADDDSCTARRLSDLLREQQEPFLLQDPDGDQDDTGTPTTVRWADGLLAGCFSFPFSRAGAATTTTARQRSRSRFRRLPFRRAKQDDGDGDGHVVVASASAAAGCNCNDGNGRQQRSPVSVLDHDLPSSDDESSAVPSHRDEHSDGDGKPSTSEKELHVPAWEWESESTGAAVDDDASRIPNLVELDDMSASPRDDWHRLVVGFGGGGEEDEARQVALSVEAIIFEEVRWEAVRDMLCFFPSHNTECD